MQELSALDHAVSYDAMTAHVSIVFTRYMFLAVAQRESKDERILGELFYLLMGELLDICLAEAVRLLVSFLAERLQERAMLSEQDVQAQLEGFLSELPSLLSKKNCENVHNESIFSATKLYFSSFDEYFDVRILSYIV